MAAGLLAAGFLRPRNKRPWTRHDPEEAREGALRSQECARGRGRGGVLGGNSCTPPSTTQISSRTFLPFHFARASGLLSIPRAISKFTVDVVTGKPPWKAARATAKEPIGVLDYRQRCGPSSHRGHPDKPRPCRFPSPSQHRTEDAHTHLSWPPKTLLHTGSGLWGKKG